MDCQQEPLVGFLPSLSCLYQEFLLPFFHQELIMGVFIKNFCFSFFYQELRNYRISLMGCPSRIKELQNYPHGVFSSRIKELQKSQPAKFLNSLILDKKKDSLE